MPEALPLQGLTKLWSERLIATRCLWVPPFTALNEPPAKSTLPSDDKAKDRTSLFAGRASSRLPVTASIAAMPPVPSSLPPTYTTPLLLTLLCTGPAGFQPSVTGSLV